MKVFPGRRALPSRRAMLVHSVYALRGRQGPLLLALGFLLALAALAAPARPLPPSGAAPALAPEKGKFRILVNGQEAGKEEFEIAQSGGTFTARGVTEIQSPQGKIKVIGTLQLRPDGTPITYDWSTEGAKKAAASISFNGPTATIQLRVEGAQPFTQQFTFNSPQIAILDNNLYDQYIVLAHLYDGGKGGLQTFSVLVPQENTPGAVTVESLGKQDFEGKKFDELQVKTEDIELDLYLDNNRLMRIVVPSSNAQIVRE